jgi:hypothetical protein
MHALDILTRGEIEHKPGPGSAADKIARLDRQLVVDRANLELLRDMRADAEIEVADTGKTDADVEVLDRQIETLRRKIDANLHARQRLVEFNAEAHVLAVQAERKSHWRRYEELMAAQIKAADQFDAAFEKLNEAMRDMLAVCDERESHLVQAMRGVVGYDQQANARSYMGRRVVEILLRSSELAADHNRNLFSGMVKLLSMTPRNTSKASELVAADAERIDVWVRAKVIGDSP